jgi:glycosyltransferase involved in cell wall biosynthesis
MIYLLANIRFPTEKAHGIQVAAMAKAFAARGSVTVVVPRRRTSGDAREVYGLPDTVKILRVPVLDTVRFGRIGFLFESLQFAVLGGLAAALRARRGDAVISREYLAAAVPRLLGRVAAWETHRGEWNWAVRLSLALGVKVVAISRGLADDYAARGVPREKILVAPDAVDFEKFCIAAGKEECRAALGFSPEARLAVYAGHLYGWKGAQVLARAAALLPAGWEVAIVGGTDLDLSRFRAEFGAVKNLRIVGRVPHGDVPRFLRAADVAVLPNLAEDALSARYTSPLKLYEYLASGTPVVASDIPSLRETLSPETAILVPPGDAAALAAAVASVPDDASSADRAARGQKIARAASWTSRAESVASFARG